MVSFSFAPKDRVFFDLLGEAGENAFRRPKLLRDMLDRWPDGKEMTPQIDLRERLDLYNGVRPIPADEWEHRFDALVERRTRVARRVRPAAGRVERDIAAAVAEVRSARRR